MNVIVLVCSHIILLSFSVRIFPSPSKITLSFSISGINNSVSYTFVFPLKIVSIRSNPIPVSTFFCASSVKLPSASLLNCIKTLFQISTYFPQWQDGPQFGEHFGLPISQNISVSGPQGPVCPAGPHQLHSLPYLKICSFLSPWLFHISTVSSSAGAISSPSNTVTANRSTGMFKYFVRNSKLIEMASCLKQSPKDQFPSISKNVQCVSSPTSSISSVLTHFCTSVSLFPLGCFSPSKYGTNGCIPAIVNNTVGSLSGRSDADAISLCPLSLKKFTYICLNSFAVMFHSPF